MAKKTYSLKQMSNAAARDDGLAVKFLFRTHQGEDLEIECPPAAIPEIVARLTGALEQAARNVGTMTEGTACGIHAERYALGAALDGPPALLMHLFPMRHCPIGFHLALEVADKLAADLPGAVAAIRRRLQTTH
jgi:hypothetical protein